MNLTKTFGLAFLATALLFSACKKDDDDDGGQQTCRVAKSVSYDNTGAREDSALFTYTDSRITKAAAPDYYYTYEYSGDRVSKRNAFSAGQTTPDYYQTITYNSDGSISKVETLEPSGTTGTLYDRMDFIYTAGKIQKIDYTIFSSGTGTKVAEFVYTYTGSNVTSVNIVDLTDTPPSNTLINYTYDANTNYLKKQNSQIYLLDPFFGDVDPTLMPFVISANNVSGLSVGGSTPVPFTYILDDKQNLIEVKLSNQPFVSYTYQCQ